MIIKKTFRYRLKPGRKKKHLFACSAGSCRWVYNFGLNAKKLAYEELDETLTCFDLNNFLPQLKKEEETEWLKDVHSQILQQALHDLNQAYQHFFRRVKQGEAPGYPKFKKKGTGDSFRYPQGVKVENDHAYLPKIGWVRFKKSREIVGEIKQTTVIREARNWYICFSCEIETDVKTESLRKDSIIGIDVGLSSFATLVSGKDNQVEEIENPRFLKKGLRKLRFLNKTLSKKMFRSNNRYKARHRLQVFQAQLKNCRKDFAHKLSTRLVKNHDIVAIENLSITSLLQNSCSSLARSIADASWGQFLGFLKYKLEYSGKDLVEADRWFASTKTCSQCSKKKEMALSDRVFCCSCGFEVGRDINAAINLKNIALEKYKAAGTTV
jgi:putative transposase